MDGTQGLTTCYDCVKLTTDIAKDIPRESHINFCRNCERFLHPPSQWIKAQPESRELLALLLKRLRGLNKVRLVDARFIWTEPHSRRLRIKLSVQGEAMSRVIIQQDFEVEYVVVATQCPDCAKSFTVHTWAAVVQIRQKVPHKRTFFYLEQMILRYRAHMDTVNIKESRDGIDFYYSQKNHALKMIDFLATVVPIRYTKSEELISQDTQSGKKSYKFSYSVQLVPVCREDLVFLPSSVAKPLGNISQLAICSRVTNNLQFLDPHTLQIADVSASVYWRNSFASLSDASNLIEFFIEDIEPVGATRGKYALADCIVRRSSNMNESYVIRTHLGGVLRRGDFALGYFLVTTNFNNVQYEAALVKSQMPDVVLVKKFYPRRKKAQNRIWKLKRMAKEHNIEDDPNTSVQDLERVEYEYEQFLQQIEEDPELQQAFDLYKKPNSQSNVSGPKARAARMEVDHNNHQEDNVAETEEGPAIDVDQLLEDLEDMTLDE